MTDLHKLIGTLARRRPTPLARYGLTLLLIGVMTFIRSLAPAYVAPFLLYIPVLLAVSIAAGWDAGLLSLALSTAIAAWFYVHDVTPTLTGAEIFLLFQYAVVGAILVWICDALRRVIIQNEATLERLNAANRTLLDNEAALRDASADAKAAKEAAVPDPAAGAKGPPL